MAKPEKMKFYDGCERPSACGVNNDDVELDMYEDDVVTFTHYVRQGDFNQLYQEHLKVNVETLVELLGRLGYNVEAPYKPESNVCEHCGLAGGH